jgi:pimeloyl-ACP methyl ester carboxylesterase
VKSAAVVLVGHSAGGQLGLLAGSAARVPVVAIAAAADFDMWESDGARAFLGNADRADTSPRRRLPLGIRQVIVHGLDDAEIPVQVSQRYVEAARAAGDDAEFVGLPSAGHFNAIDPRSASWPRVERAVCDVLGL